MLSFGIFYKELLSFSVWVFSLALNFHVRVEQEHENLHVNMYINLYTDGIYSHSHVSINCFAFATIRCYLYLFLLTVSHKFVAMDVGGEVMESTIPSLIVDSVQKGEVLSPEDSAWVDSCLISESDILDDDWSSLKGALLEILNSEPESLSSSALPSGEGADTEHFQRRTQRSLLPINEDAESGDDDMPTDEDASNLQSSTFTGNPFLPGYRDDELGVTGNLELGANVVSTVSEMEPSTEDIFRVWDLDVLVEEDDLVKQLEKALEESSLQPLPPTFNDSDVWKNLKVDSVDALIAGIADLSLVQSSR